MYDIYLKLYQSVMTSINGARVRRPM